MKKLSILLILAMMMSLLPALNVSAAEYTLSGISEGETVIYQEEPSKTVKLAKADGSALSGISKVAFSFNDGGFEEVYGTAFEYEMEFTELGEQTLSYNVYRTGSEIPVESNTVTFNVVSGKLHELSFTENFENPTADYSQDNLKKMFVGGDGANISSRLNLSVQEFKGSKALVIDGDKQNKPAYMQLVGAPSTSGLGIHFYEFDMTMSTSYSRSVAVTADGYDKVTNAHTLFTNKNTDVGIGTNSDIGKSATAKLRIILNYNTTPPTATIYKNGTLWQNISMTKLAEGTEDPVITISVQTNSKAHPVYIDNFRYTAYEKAVPQDFTSVTIPGGDKPVATDLSEIRFTGGNYLAGQSVEEFVTISEKPNDGSADFTESSLDYRVAIEGEEVVVSFNQALSEATTYKVDIIGLKDDCLMTYNNPEFIFRTLNPDENPLPEVELLAPEAGTRFYPREADTVELKAIAKDSLGGWVEYVEFYADGVLIDGSKVTKEEAVDDVFTYIWTLDGSIDRVDPVAITAKAVDDKGDDATSAARSIILRSKELPEVRITAPEMGALYYSNVSGVVIDIMPTVKFVHSDSDGTIEEINVYVDGRQFHLSDKTAMEYPLTEALTAGDHKIIVEVIDNDGQSATDTVEVSVAELGKSGYIFNDNYAEEDLLAQWKKTGKAEFKNGTLTDYAEVQGLILTGADTIKRTIIRNLEGTEFVADIKVAFNDTTSNRTVKLGDAELATFTAGGKITYGGTAKGSYEAGEVYNISAVVNPMDGKVYAIVNGERIGSASASYKINPQIIVTSTGTGEMAVITASASTAGIAVEPTVIIDGNTIAVDFEAGVDTKTLEGNVALVDSNGNAASLIYANGVFTVNEILKYTETYKVVVYPDVRDLNGNAYSGTYEVPFRVEEPAVAIADIAGSMDGSNAVLDVDFVGAEEAKAVTLVCAAYKDNMMVAYDTYELNTSAEADTYVLDLSGIVEGAVIEAFVVDNDLNAVSDKIIVLE